MVGVDVEAGRRRRPVDDLVAALLHGLLRRDHRALQRGRSLHALHGHGRASQSNRGALTSPSRRGVFRRHAHPDVGHPGRPIAGILQQRRRRALARHRQLQQHVPPHNVTKYPEHEHASGALEKSMPRTRQRACDDTHITSPTPATSSCGRTSSTWRRYATRRAALPLRT